MGLWSNRFSLSVAQFVRFINYILLWLALLSSSDVVAVVYALHCKQIYFFAVIQNLIFESKTVGSQCLYWSVWCILFKVVFFHFSSLRSLQEQTRKSAKPWEWRTTVGLYILQPGTSQQTLETGPSNKSTIGCIGQSWNSL